MLLRCRLIRIAIIKLIHIIYIYIYIVYLCPCLDLGLVMFYLCDLFFIFSVIFIGFFLYIFLECLLLSLDNNVGVESE